MIAMHFYLSNSERFTLRLVEYSLIAQKNNFYHGDLIKETLKNGEWVFTQKIFNEQGDFYSISQKAEKFISNNSFAEPVLYLAEKAFLSYEILKSENGTFGFYIRISILEDAWQTGRYHNEFNGGFKDEETAIKFALESMNLIKIASNAYNLSLQPHMTFNSIDELIAFKKEWLEKISKAHNQFEALMTAVFFAESLLKSQSNSGVFAKVLIKALYEVQEIAERINATINARSLSNKLYDYGRLVKECAEELKQGSEVDRKHILSKVLELKLITEMELSQ